MKISKAIKILKTHNEWRKGGDGIIIHPKTLSIVIDTIVEYFDNGECEHPFNRLHWVDNVVFCNKCKKTLHK